MFITIDVGVDIQVIGDSIRKARKEKNISISELARRTGVSKSYISMVESGQYKNPSVSVLKKLCTALDITFEEIINDEPVQDEWLELADLARKSGISIDEFREFITKKIQEYKGK